MSIAPDVTDDTPVDALLGGLFLALVVLLVVGARFMTVEYRRGLVRTTLAASPRRGRVLAAKAIVLGGVASAVILPYLLAAALPVLPAGAAGWVLRGHPGRRLRDHSGHPGLPAGGRQLHAVRRLLPARAVVRLRRDLRLGRPHTGPGRPPAAPERRVRQFRGQLWV